MGKVKQWKVDGEEDKFIEKLMKQGKVHKNTKPATLQNMHPTVFGEFSSSVIRNHFNIIKRKHGLYLDVDEEVEDADESKPQETNDSYSDIKDVMTNVIDKAVHYNYPVLCEKYTDPDNQYEKVIMLVCLPSGAQGVKIELTEDGLMAVIKYSWCNAMFDIDDIFKKKVTTQEINTHHPKLLCLKKGLEGVRKRIDVSPDAIIKVQLPLKVQTASDSWSKWGVKREDGTQIVVGEFTGFIKEYIKKASDETVVFDM